MLKRYLEELRGQEKTASKSARELAKLAGVKLRDCQCPECGCDMKKQGGLYKCACGMMKRAYQLEFERPGIGERYVAPATTTLGASGGALGGAHIGGTIAPNTPRGQLIGRLAGGLLGGTLGGAAGLGAGSLARREMGVQRVLENRQRLKDYVTSLRANRALQMAHGRIPPHHMMKEGMDPMVTGALVGGAGGAGLGALTSEKEKRLRGALIGGAAGGILGAGLGGLSKGKYTEADRLAQLAEHAQQMEAHGAKIQGMHEIIGDLQKEIGRKNMMIELGKRARGL